MHIAAIQHDVVWADRASNFAALEPLIRQAAHDGATFIVLTELFSTGFVVDDSTIAEPEGGPSSQFISELATDLGVWICGSCPETTKDNPNPFNSLVLAHPSGEQSRYRKIHRFSYGGEDRHYRAGEQFLTVNIDGVRTSFFTCYDLRFADEFWDLAPDTDLYVVPANWPTQRQHHWTTLLTARAIENQAYVVGCNRVGTGGGQSYTGDSLILDPLGKELARGSHSTQILHAHIDPSVVTSTREKFPFLQDRR